MIEMNGEKWLEDGYPFNDVNHIEDVIELDSKRPKAEDEQVCMNAHDYNELMDLWAEVHGEEYEFTDKLKEASNG